MKILRSIHSVNPAIGGPIESVKQSSAVLARRGHSVELVSLDAPDDRWVRECPLPVHAFGPGRGSYGYAAAFVPWLREQRREYDAVIAQGVWQYSSFGVWRALHGTSTPYYVFPHGMLDPWFKRTYPLKHLKKLLYWPWGEYRVLRDAAAVLFTSEEERRLARESFALYRCREVVVNYGTAAPTFDLATARAEFLDRFPHLRGKRLLLFLGRLHEKKGCELLLEAFASIRSDLHLVLAGPAGEEAYLARLKQSASDAVTFTGMLSGSVKSGAFAAAEAFILPSHQENFGIAVVEALACGVPVLISNKVNIWREIESDGAGFVENDDLAGTKRLIERWLATSTAEREQMRASASNCFAARFDIERAVDSLLEVLQQPR
ncbi:MAG: glycosyltransferase [Verrucomicrobiota bacterium]|nr:glycosyltransferase [Verrucomicrobiota bacterium]